MISRKITFDSRVRYIPKIEETQKRESKPKTTNNRKQDKKNSQNKKEMINDVIRGSDFPILKR